MVLFPRGFRTGRGGGKKLGRGGRSSVVKSAAPSSAPKQETQADPDPAEPALATRGESIGTPRHVGERCRPAQTPWPRIHTVFFFFPSPEKHGGSPRSRIRSLAPRLLLAAPRGNPQSVEAEPMSGGQNHKGIERLNIFLGAELGKGFRFWDVRSRCPPRTSFVLVGGTIFLHQTRI